MEVIIRMRFKRDRIIESGAYLVKMVIQELPPYLIMNVPGCRYTGPGYDEKE
jgi:hypothetical protein